MGCFVPGTPITLADGTQKPIETIRVGDKVLTHTGRVEPVTYVMDRRHDGIVYDVKTYGQSVPMILTEEHPVWTKKGWVEAKDLTTDDYILSPTLKDMGHPGAYPFARLLGYYLAEGNLGFDRKRFADGRPTFVEWSFHSDEVEYIEEIKTLLDAIGYRAAGPYIKNNCASIRCNSPELADRFLTYGGQHSWNKRLHTEVMSWDTENQRGLLQAYFNGDGCYRNDGKRVEAGTASQRLAQQLQLIATRVGIKMTPPVKQHSPSAVLAGKRPKYSMQAVLEPAERVHYGAHLDEQGLWRKISAISIKEYQGNVYNFDVEGDDSYVAADVAVHNCDVDKSICNICRKEASAPDEYCEHIKSKGAEFNYIDSKTGERTSKKSYEDCYGIKFFEISAVFDPADETALVREVRHEGSTKEAAPLVRGMKCPECLGVGETGHGPCMTCEGTGEMRVGAGGDGATYDTVPRGDYMPIPGHKGLGLGTGTPRYQGKVADRSETDQPQSELTKAPTDVDTLREESICPICGSTVDHESCDVCFTPDTLIRTKQGYVPISTVEVGDRVLSGSGKFNRVLEVMERPYHGILNQIGSGSMVNPVQVTGEHPFQTIVGNHISKKAPCKPDRCNRSINHPRSKTTHELGWVAAHDIDKTNYLVTNFPKEEFDLNSIDVPLDHQSPRGYARNGPTEFELDSDFLWMIGMYIAEGSSGTRKINFALHRNETEYQQRLIDFFTRHGFNTKLVLRDSKPNSAWVEVYSATLASWFPQWLGSGSHNKEIPAELLNLPLSKVEGVWQGILDGDGHNSREQLGQTSPTLALQMSEIAMRRGGEPSVQVEHPIGKKTVYKINGTTIATLVKASGRTKRGTWRFGDKYLSRVTEAIEVPYCGPVFNLRVEDDPTYTVENIVVHNCGYITPPEGFGNPDLEKAQENTMGDPDADKVQQPGQEAPPAAAPEAPEPVKAAPTPGITSSMKLKPIINSRVANRGGGDEPDETIVKDETAPTTKRTAQRLIAKAERNNQEAPMQKNAEAAAGAPEAATPDKRVDVEGVGGIMDANAEAASKADAQVDVMGQGGTGVSGVEADEHQSVEETSDNAGFDAGGNPSNNSGPTKTWGDNSTNPVTNQAFPTAAVQGVKPIGGADVQPQRREDVESDAGWKNPGTGTDQWTGTGGNKVNRQQDAVTNKGTQSGGITSHVVNIFKLADTEVEMGLLESDKKYERIAELEQASPEMVQELMSYASRVKKAGLSKQTRTSSAHRVPSFSRIAKTEAPVETPIDESFLDSSLFG